jgi:hypothetical protein
LIQRLREAAQRRNANDPRGGALPLRATKNRRTDLNFDLNPDDASGPGNFSAVISVLNVVDLQGDVAVASAFEGTGTVYLSDWEHSSFDPSIPKRAPVGVATIGIVGGNKVVATGTFFRSEAGQACRELFKATRPQMSYGFVILKSSTDPALLRQWPGARRVLQRLLVTEVSPVALGAGGPDVSALWAKRERTDPELLAILANVQRAGQLIRNSPEQRELRAIEANLRRQISART